MSHPALGDFLLSLRASPACLQKILFRHAPLPLREELEAGQLLKEEGEDLVWSERAFHLLREAEEDGPSLQWSGWVEEAERWLQESSRL